MKRQILLVAMVWLTGCVTDFNQGQVNRNIEQHENQALLSERLNKLSDQVQILVNQQDNLQRELASLQNRLNQFQAGTGGASAAELQRLQTMIAKVDTARQQDKQIILDEVAKQLDAMTRRSGKSATTKATPTTTPLTSGGTETGYEHVVKAGETVTAIAKAYGVSVDAIMKANNLKNPGSLKVGQKLFVPKK